MALGIVAIAVCVVWHSLMCGEVDLAKVLADSRACIGFVSELRMLACFMIQHSS